MTEPIYRHTNLSFRFKQILSFLVPVLIEQRPGILSSQLEVSLENGCLVLNSEKANYSYGNLHAVFLRAFFRAQISKRPIRNALILGFGGGSINDILRDNYSLTIPITGIEKDKEVVALYEKYFADELDEQTQVIQTDASDYVLRCTEKFSLIAIDLFIDLETPVSFSKKDFLLAATSLLEPGGILFYNRIAATTNGVQEITEILNTFGQLPGRTREDRLELGGMTNIMIIYEN